MAKSMQAGDLDRKIDIYQLDTHRSSKGEIGKSPSPFLTGLACNWKDTGGNEAEETGKEVATGDALATIRYRMDITESMLVKYQGIFYDILNVSEGAGRRQWTVLKVAKHQ